MYFASRCKAIEKQQQQLGEMYPTGNIYTQHIDCQSSPIAVHVQCIKFNVTVHSRYLGTKKPLDGFYHYINIGCFFIFLDKKNGIKLHIRDAFSNQSVRCRG